MLGFYYHSVAKYALMVLILLCTSIAISAKGLTRVELSEYGAITPDKIEETLVSAINDIEGKRLILPETALNIGNLTIKGKNNFEIVGSKNNPICCMDFLIQDCSDFELSRLFIKGTKEKFATFYIKGDCSNFSIHDCLFDSEKGADGHNQFYGIHVIADGSNPKASYENSPRHFRIYNNLVKNTRYDGILAHAHCYDFVIEKNTIIGAECIGIEVEGRYGGLNNTTVHPCKDVIIRNNLMYDCGDWGVLLMWVDNIKVYGNKSYNAFGTFLSIGCTNLEVKNNILEGTHKGFELSNEFFKIENGINNHILVKGNTIVGRARGDERGVLDVRHSRNVVIKKNKVYSIYRDNSAMVSVASSQDVLLRANIFNTKDNVLPTAILFNNVVDCETEKAAPDLDVKNVSILSNTFVGQREGLKQKNIDMTVVDCIVKSNKYK